MPAATSTATSPYLSVQGFADACGVSARTIWRELRAQQIPYVRIGSAKRVRIPRTALENYGVSGAALPSAIRQPGVYFIQCGSFIKIGCAGHLPRRLRTLELSMPFDVSVLLTELAASLAVARALERQLHDRFRPHRHRGEWFHDVPAIRQYIQRQTDDAARHQT